MRKAAIIFLLSLALLWQGQQGWNESTSDQRQYDWLSFSILTRGEFQAPKGFPGAYKELSYSRRTPGFPLYLATIYRVFGDDPTLEEWGRTCTGRDCLPPPPLRRAVEQVTALLAAVTVTGVFALTLALAGLLPALLALCACLGWFYYAQSVLFESLAAFLLFWHAAALWQTWRHPRLPAAIASGLFLGLLVLTKAAFQYWLVAVPVVLLAACWLQPDRRRARASAALVLTACMVAVPWMVRNALHAGHFSVSGRSSDILSIRAEYGTMSWPEIVGAYGYWTPAPRAIPGHTEVTNRIMKFLEPEVGYAGFDRGDKNGYYMRSQRHAGMVAHRAGIMDPLWTASETRLRAAVRRAALTMIREDWLKHLTLTPAFLLRGTGAMGLGLFGLLAVPAFGLVLVSAWRRRDIALLLFLMPAVYTFAFHATVTHFIPRYGMPAVPVAFVVCGWASVHLPRAFRRP